MQVKADAFLHFTYILGISLIHFLPVVIFFLLYIDQINQEK